MTIHERQIKEIVDRETRAWDTQDIKTLMTIFHKDMVWPWPPTAQAHDPMDWIFCAGRYDYERWTRNWQELFDTHTLVHDRRVIRKIAVTPEGDGGFAVVDVDTLWRDANGKDFHWLGRACKVYSKVGKEWKMTMHTGLLDYGKASASSPERPAKKQLRAVAR
jgi:ketosteroid isomerase-like protein